MEKEEKIRKSPYYYSVSDWLKMKKADKKRYAKALVYDFLKKKRLLGKIYDYQTQYNPVLAKDKNIPFLECLNYSIEKLIEDKIALRDYFFNSATMFEWDGEGYSLCKEMEKIDKAWLKLIDENIGK